jgi:hypothetical protein
MCIYIYIDIRSICRYRLDTNVLQCVIRKTETTVTLHQKPVEKLLFTVVYYISTSRRVAVYRICSNLCDTRQPYVTQKDYPLPGM